MHFFWVKGVGENCWLKSCQSKENCLFCLSAHHKYSIIVIHLQLVHCLKVQHKGGDTTKSLDMCGIYLFMNSNRYFSPTLKAVQFVSGPIFS